MTGRTAIAMSTTQFTQDAFGNLFIKATEWEMIQAAEARIANGWPAHIPYNHPPGWPWPGLRRPRWWGRFRLPLQLTNPVTGQVCTYSYKNHIWSADHKSALGWILVSKEGYRLTITND